MRYLAAQACVRYFMALAFAIAHGPMRTYFRDEFRVAQLSHGLKLRVLLQRRRNRVVLAGDFLGHEDRGNLLRLKVVSVRWIFRSLPSPVRDWPAGVSMEQLRADPQRQGFD
jgi:hypothetical protein